MKNIDLIREVIQAAADRWPTVLAGLHIDVPDSPRRHAPCPACGGSDRFRFDDGGRGSFICNQCGAGDGLDLIKRVNNCDTTEAAQLAADVLGIDYRTVKQGEATASQKREQMKAESQQREQERQRRKLAEIEQRRGLFVSHWQGLAETAFEGESEYLMNKGLVGFNFPVLPDGSLLLGLVNESGAVTAAQTITPQGEKRLLAGSAKRGAYHAVNAADAPQSVLIAEGLATALSVHLIRQEALTVCAIDAGNLQPVAQVMHQRYPNAQIIIAADNDIKPGEPNIGKDAAEKAAKAVSGWVALPPTVKKADWNDYHQQHGLEAATTAFKNSMYQPQEPEVSARLQVINGGKKGASKPESLRPHVESRADGIFWVEPKSDKDTGEITTRESWLCSALEVIGTGIDDSKTRYLILRWRPFGSKGDTVQAIPFADIGEREGWRTLKAGGVNVTALQITVHGAGFRIFPHHRPTVHMGGLVGGGIKVAVGVFRAAEDIFRLHRFGDRRHLIEHKLRHLDVVVLPVEGHAQQRLAEDVFVVRIKIEVVLPIGLVRAVGIHRQVMGVGVGHRRFPLAAPRRGARRYRETGDGLGPGLVDPERRTADEAGRAMVEVVGVEVVDADAVAARADKRIGIGVFVENGLDGGHVLVGEVTPHHPFAGLRIVRFADPGEQHQVHVVE
ncbi:MAG: toprim domain-containing protein, partial [Klebsiella pneumoniae]|nr:toprim domain-containing protein [Klebsiella pneumoniae]